MEKEKIEGIVAAQSVIYVSPASIVPNPAQPRRNFDAATLAALADSIRRVGVLCPLLVRRTNEGLELIAGERRLRAAISIGLERVPCILRDAEPEECARLAIIENLQRENLNMFEQAQAMRSLAETCKMTQESIAEALSCSQSYVANKIRLLRLTQCERQRILELELTERHARALLRLDPLLRAEVIETVAKKHMNVATTEELVEKLLCKSERERTAARVENIERDLKKRLLSRDMRLFYNSIERAVESVKSCGIPVEAKRRGIDGGTVIEIFVPASENKI